MTKKIDDLLNEVLPTLRTELTKMKNVQRMEYIGKIVVALTMNTMDNRELIQTLLKSSITVYLMTEQDNSRNRFVGLVDRAFAVADLPARN